MKNYSKKEILLYRKNIKNTPWYENLQRNCALKELLLSIISSLPSFMEKITCQKVKEIKSELSVLHEYLEAPEKAPYWNL